MTSSVLRPVARHAVVAFMVIGLAAAFLAAGVVPPIVDAQVLPFDLSLYGMVGGFLGVGVVPSSSPTRCPDVPGWPTSPDAACAGGSRCAGI